MKPHLEHRDAPNSDDGVTGCERALVETMTGSASDIADAVENLLAMLLAKVDRYSHHSTDGVILEWQEVTPRGAWCVGTVVMIDGQLVEPFRLDVSLDPPGAGIESGVIRFGDADAPAIEYGSSRHERMVKRILADPRCEFRWKLRFSRGPQGWRGTGSTKRGH